MCLFHVRSDEKITKEAQEKSQEKSQEKTSFDPCSGVCFSFVLELSSCAEFLELLICSFRSRSDIHYRYNPPFH